MPNIPSLWREFAAIVMRKQRPSTVIAASYPEGERYPAANGSVSSILVPLVLVGFLGDIPLSLVIVALCHPNHPFAIHAGIAAVSLWSLGWVIAARSALLSIPHVVGKDALWIGGGARLSGVIPKVAIERVLSIRGSRREWMSEQGVSRDQVTLASGFDPPNLAVEIKQAALQAVKIGTRRRHSQPSRWVLLYADSPAALAKAALSPLSNDE
jgi:hypothetical protein